MTAYDLRTSYSNDYQIADFIDSVTWESGDTRVTGLKGRWGDFDTPESQSLAAGLNFTSEAAAVVIWQPTPTDETTPPDTFAPVEGHILRREDTGEGWLVLRVAKSRLGHWLCACEKEVLNA